MNVNECMEEFKSYVASYCSEMTVEYYNINLRLFSNYLISTYGNILMDINVLQKKDFIGYITFHRSRSVRNTSVRTYARAVKVFLRYCYNEGYLLEDITRNVKYPKSDNKLIAPLSSGRASALHDEIFTGNFPERNLCIFHLMLDCGLRLSEVVNLNHNDIDFDNKLLVVRCSKNNKSRIVPLPELVRSLLYCYYDTQPFRLYDDDSVFLTESGCRITKNAISMMFYKLKKIDSEIHPHLLRHTFATSFILGGGSLEVLRVLLGHSDYNVTREYLHIAGQFAIVNYDIYKLDNIFFQAYNYNRNFEV